MEDTFDIDDLIFNINSLIDSRPEVLIEEIQSLNSKNTIYFSSLILVIIAMGGVIAYLIIRRPKEASTAPTNTSMLQQEINELKTNHKKQSANNTLTNTNC